MNVGSNVRVSTPAGTVSAQVLALGRGAAQSVYSIDDDMNEILGAGAVLQITSGTSTSPYTTGQNIILGSDGVCVWAGNLSYHPSDEDAVDLDSYFGKRPTRYKDPNSSLQSIAASPAAVGSYSIVATAPVTGGRKITVSTGSSSAAYGLCSTINGVVSGVGTKNGIMTNTNLGPAPTQSAAVNSGDATKVDITTDDQGSAPSGSVTVYQ